MGSVNVVAHNLSSMFSQRQLGITTRTKGKISEKLGSGYRINRAADDAAGLSISEKMRWRIRGLNQGTENTQDGISWLQIGDGAMAEVNDIVHRMTELSVKGANGTLSESDRYDIDNEIQELKNELNRISTTTKFNTLNIFESPKPVKFAAISVKGCPADMTVFDASYDDATGKVSFGGILYNGNRISWDTINSDMVYEKDGEQYFKGGIYSYTAPDGSFFKISAGDGTKVPEFTREVSIGADVNSGICIDGRYYPWENLKDDFGNGMSSDNVHKGFWTMDHEGMEITLELFEGTGDLLDVVNALDNHRDNDYQYTIKTKLSHTEDETAVTAKGKNLAISNDLSSYLASKGGIPGYFTVKADDDGVYIDELGSNSKMTWSELGIDSWDNGDDISTDKTYHYYYEDAGNTSRYLSFDFELSDITSRDSVIDGLDGMKLNISSYINSYDTEIKKSSSAPADVIRVKGSVSNVTTFDDETSLNRNFDVNTGAPNTWNGSLSMDGTGKVTLSFGGGVVTYEGAASNLSDLTQRIADYMSLAESGMKADLLSGGTGVWNFPDLKSVVGNSNLTTSGNMNSPDEHVTISAGMKYTTNSPLTDVYVGGTYATAHIDFSNVTDLDQLVGTGFNSTCMTCDNHYSVIFGNNLAGASSTSSGYKYVKSESGNNYDLSIDIGSLKSRGVNSSNIADALVEILGDSYNFHYTQYASENGSKLYVFDGRTSEADNSKAEFNTKPYETVDQGNLIVSLNRVDGTGSASLDYTVEFTDAKDKIHVSMEALSGTELENPGSYYKKNDDGSYTAFQYIPQYDDDTHQLKPPTETLYKYKAEYDLSASDIANKILSDAANSTSTDITLKTTDFSKLNTSAKENPNKAVRAVYESYVEKIPIHTARNGILIQHSNETPDQTFIPQFEMNALALGLSNAGTRTMKEAERTIDMTKKANRYVARCRSEYGALQNRMEHAVKINENTAENTTAAESRIRDADMAKLSLQYSTQNILEQAGMSVLSQAEQSQQAVLSLLQ